MVISEKQVADQLKALNIGFKPTKEQVEETLLYIDSVRINQPKAYKKFKESIFDPYETKVRDLEAEYGEFKRGIILQTADAEKALQQIVDRSIQEGKNPNIDDATREAAKQSVETIKQGYTERMLPTFDVRIKAVKEKLATGDDRAKKLLELLEAVLKNVTSASVNALQTEMLSGRTGVMVSKKGDPDGYFGPLTMSALEMIAGVKADEAKVVASTQQAGIENTPTQTEQQTTLLQDIKSKAREAGEAIANTVSGTANAQEVDKKSDKPPVGPNPKSKPGEGFVLKDGTKVQGIFVKEGRVWFIGEKGERKELNPSLLPDGVNAKEIAATNKKAEKLMPLASDVELVLQAVANHAAIEKWPSAAKWGNKIGEFRDMLPKLNVSDYNDAREKILKFILSAPTAKSNIAWEFADVFASLDNDAERHAKVYKYIRGSWYNPLASGAGFAGGSEMLSNRIASAELAKKKIGPKELEAFVNNWRSKSWGSYSDKEVAGAIMRSQNAGGMYAFVKEAYGEKNLVDFVSDFRRAAKDIDKAFSDPNIQKEYAKAIPDINAREKHISESKIAKLMSILSTSSLAAYAGTHESELSKNPELKTFADIQGVGTFDMSDTTAKYIRNDLWKDVAIEVAAIGAGALTAGAGAALIHAMAATRWAVHAGEVARIGIRAEQVAARVVIGGGLFEGAHVAARKGFTGQDIFTTEGYSTAGFLQSMAFAGVFEGMSKLLQVAKVPKFDPSKGIFEQKGLLATYVSADAAAALGVSYGISWSHDENYTFQEAFQAIAMAALFRTAMTRAEGVKFRVKKTPEDGLTLTPESTVLTPGAPASAAPGARVTPTSTPGSIVWFQPTTGQNRRTRQPVKPVGENATPEPTAIPKRPTNEDATPATPKPTEEGSGVQSEKKTPKEKKAENDQKKIYHVLELAEPGYKKFKEGFFNMAPSRRIKLMDAAVKEWFLIGKPYWLLSSAVKWLTWVMIENIIGGVLKSVTRPVDVFLNAWKTLWKEVKFVDKPLSTWRSLVYADRRTHADFEGATGTWKWRRRADPAALLILGTAAAFNHESENEYEWFKECLKSLVGGVILTTYRNQEWVHAVTVWEKNNNKTVGIEPTAHFTEEKPFEPNPVNPTQETKAEDETPAEVKAENATPSDSAADVSQESESKTPETPDAPASSDVIVNQ